jgi:hypothetical protein
VTEISKPTFEEAMDTLTGWDEIAIEKASGYTIEAMSDETRVRALQLTRCVAAVLVARSKEMPYGDAWREVMGWPQSRVQGMFAPEPEDVIADEPDSDSGKGDSPDGLALTTSPHSVSSPE